MSATPAERNHILGKLRQFLEEYVGNVPDAQVRASEMAVKFEEQVFATSRSKEEYLQTIQAKMRQVQASKLQQQVPPPAVPAEGLVRHPSVDLTATNGVAPSPVQFNEQDRQTFIQKIGICRDLLPRMEKLIEIHGRLGTSPDIIRKYASYKNVIQRQVELLPSNVFIMPLASAITLHDQATKMTIFLATKAKEIYASQPDLAKASSTPAGGAGSSSHGGSQENVKAKKGDTLTAFEGAILANKQQQQQQPQVNPLRPVYPASRAAEFWRIAPDLRMVKDELTHLSATFGAAFCTEFNTNRGEYIITASLGEEQLLISVPPDYPSCEPLRIRRYASPEPVHEEIQVVPPVTLTTTLSLIFAKRIKP